MKHVLLVSNTTRNIYHYRRTVWVELLNNGYRISVVAAEDDRASELRGEGISCYDVPLLADYGKSPLRLCRLYRQLSDLYLRLAPEVILHFTIQPNTVGSLAAARRKIPSAATITGLGTTWLQSVATRWVTTRLYRWSLRSSDLVITQNGEDKRELEGRGVHPPAWRLVPGSGVNTEEFPGRTDTALPEQRTFLYLGRMLVDKGVAELFAAWQQAWQVGLRGQLWLVGERPAGHPRALSDETWERGIKLPGVSHFPSTDEVPAYLFKSHFVVLPSYREGLSLTLLEALATETPVLTTLVPGCRELVVGQHTGWAVPPRSAAALAEALLAAHRMPYEEWRRMGQNGRRLIKAKYSARMVANAYLEVVKSLARS